MSPNYFCPYCMSTMPPVEFRDGGRLRLSCGNCGYPVDTEAGFEAVPEAPHRPKVLCIDDDRLLLGLFVDALEANGFQPLTAANGPAGIEMAKKERPDLILVDVMMPGMSGIDVCRTLRAQPGLAATPIIVVTALSDSRIPPKANEAGATMVMQKPYETTHLIEAIRKTLPQAPGAPASGKE